MQHTVVKRVKTGLKNACSLPNNPHYKTDRFGELFWVLIFSPKYQQPRNKNNKQMKSRHGPITLPQLPIVAQYCRHSLMTFLERSLLLDKLCFPLKIDAREIWWKSRKRTRGSSSRLVWDSKESQIEKLWSFLHFLEVLSPPRRKSTTLEAKFWG